MLIRTKDNQFEMMGSDQASVERQLHDLYRDLLDRNEIVQEVIIDGVSYRDGYNEMIIHNYTSIEHVEFHTVNGDVLIAEIIQELKDYLPKLIPSLDSISELFYGEVKQEEWGYFAQLVEGIQWVVQSVQVILTHYQRLDLQVQLQEQLMASLVRIQTLIDQVEDALQREDFTALADLLKYEMPEPFEELLENLNNGGQV